MSAILSATFQIRPCTLRTHIATTTFGRRFLFHKSFHRGLFLSRGVKSFALLTFSCPAAENFKLMAEREVPLELRSEAGTLANDAGSVEAIRVRVLVRGSQPDLEAVRVCSETKLHAAPCDCGPTEAVAAAVPAYPYMTLYSAKCYTGWPCCLTCLYIHCDEYVPSGQSSLSQNVAPKSKAH